MAKIDSSHIIDSQFFGDDYSTIASRAIFNDLNRINRWLEVEKALVRCQIKIGIIPKNIGEELLGKGDVGNFDLQRMLNNFKKTKHSLMPVDSTRVRPLARSFKATFTEGRPLTL